MSVQARRSYLPYTDSPSFSVSSMPLTKLIISALIPVLEDDDPNPPPPPPPPPLMLPDDP